MRRTLASGLTCLALAGGSLSAAAYAGTATTTPTASPLVLKTGGTIVTYRSGKRVYTNFPVRVVAQGAPFEIWTTRSSYADPIAAQWRNGSTTVDLPTGTVSDFAGLHHFVKLTFSHDGDVVKTRRLNLCTNTWSAQRVVPSAPARSPYPLSCSWNPYTLGSVMGLQDGWATLVDGDEWRAMRLDLGRYQVTASITPKWRDLFGIDPADATGSFTLVVKKFTHPTTDHPSARPVSDPPPSLQPAPMPSADDQGADEPRPDLEALPAGQIKLSKDKQRLQFAATVWNGGQSPLVVDGYRDSTDVPELTAYQYFFDADGNQVGYRQIGAMEWDPRPTHQHWHFENFAKYSLVDADKQQVVVSKKEAFCLANTDAVDLTVPGAAWKTTEEDLGTVCGDQTSLAVREALNSAWGDTYAQYRGGQALRVGDLPNGVYYIKVEANPFGNILESDTTNNVSYRKVVLKGSGDSRRVVVPQVGMVVEPPVDQGASR